MTTTPTSPTLQTWLQAARPRTLPAAAAPVLVASALAWRDGVFSLPAALACLAVSLLMQIAANFSNDLFDHERGSDTPDRLGPLRATAAGLVSPAQMRIATALVFGLAAIFGLYLFFLQGWLILALGAAIALAALAYTGGPFPYGYHGLGDLFVFLTFGLAAVYGTYFAQSGQLIAEVGWYAVPVGVLIINILVVNNTRDIDTDRAANKRTLAVLLGREAMQTEYLLCLLIAYLTPLALWASRLSSAGILLSLLSLPLAIAVYREFIHSSGRALNLTLARSAQLALIFSLLFAAGLLL